MTKKTTELGVGKKVLASALSAAMVVAFAPAVAMAEGEGAQGSEALAASESGDAGDAQDAQVVAKIGDTTYTSLQNAIDAATDGAVVTLQDNIDLTRTVIVDGKNIVLDANGKTIYNTSNIWDKDTGNWSLISVRGSNGNLVVTGNGTFKSKDNDCYNIDVQDNAHVIIENGTYIGNIHAIYVLEGLATVKGGFYSVAQKYPTAGKENEFVLNCLDENRAVGTAKIEVTGGSFANFNPANCWAEGEGTNFCSGNGFTTSVSTSGTDNIYTVSAPVAKIDSEQYGTLKAAIDAQTSGTISLVSNVEEDITIPTGKTLPLILAVIS